MQQAPGNQISNSNHTVQQTLEGTSTTPFTYHIRKPLSRITHLHKTCFLVQTKEDMDSTESPGVLPTTYTLVSWLSWSGEPPMPEETPILEEVSETIYPPVTEEPPHSECLFLGRIPRGRHTPRLHHVKC